MDLLERWWTTKFSLPWNHELFQSSTIEELLTQYHLDYFSTNTKEIYRNEDGEIQFTNTGDSLIDKWEEEFASGEDPDLTEAFAPGELDKIRRRLDTLKGRISLPTENSKFKESDSAKLLEHGFNTFGS